ncbi:hypothetical protein [Chromatium okenii]|uniref:Uncharacterized protein n=1 Tax=Chromatium okenii TaxID=61644 RepID=A0A2S7XS43_9GAMM|nr:hypothetical protein [Chromatium okenii]PQJ96550.1 hypothetical protein CXB77_06905 [Chromatium okenii]
MIRAFQLSAVRPQHYFSGHKRKPPDICIINDDLPLGLQCWRELRRVFSANFPVVRVGSTDAPAAFASDVVASFSNARRSPAAF